MGHTTCPGEERSVSFITEIGADKLDTKSVSWIHWEPLLSGGRVLGLPSNQLKCPPVPLRVTILESLIDEWAEVKCCFIYWRLLTAALCSALLRVAEADGSVTPCPPPDGGDIHQHAHSTPERGATTLLQVLVAGHPKCPLTSLQMQEEHVTEGPLPPIDYQQKRRRSNLSLSSCGMVGKFNWGNRLLLETPC